jgi:hypothetical protein
LEPATKFRDAIEAEEVTVVRGIGGAPAARPSEPVVGVSSGRVLEFRADKIGQGFVLNVGARPKQPYVLGVRTLLSPAGAIMQAFVADKPLGPQFDLYASPRRLGPSVLPLGPVPAGTSEIEICVVGRNDRSQGLAVELDYVRWEPDLLGPGTASGVWMHALGTHACDYGPQDLGPAFSGGHQFWVRPRGRRYRPTRPHPERLPFDRQAGCGFRPQRQHADLQRRGHQQFDRRSPS